MSRLGTCNLREKEKSFNTQEPGVDGTLGSSLRRSRVKHPRPEALSAVLLDGNKALTSLNISTEVSVALDFPNKES